MLYEVITMIRIGGHYNRCRMLELIACHVTDMNIARKNPFRKLRRTNIIYPILFGIGVVAVIFYRNFDPSIFHEIHVTRLAGLWLAIAIGLMAVRDISYMIRLKILSENSFSWKQSFRIIMLWEFTSAVTPSAIGGTSFAIIFLNKEGLKLGHASAVVMATS